MNIADITKIYKTTNLPVKGGIILLLGLMVSGPALMIFLGGESPAETTNYSDFLAYGVPVLLLGIVFMTNIPQKIWEQLQQLQNKPSTETEKTMAQCYSYTVGKNSNHWELSYFGPGDSPIKQLIEKKQKKLVFSRHFQLAVDDDREQIIKKINDQLEKNGQYEVEYQLKLDDDERLRVLDRGEGEFKNDKLVMVRGVLVELKEGPHGQQNQLEFPEKDCLTGLMNRSSFIEKSEELLEQTSQQQLFCIVDIINFQAFNNFYGYSLGNLILAQTGTLLEAQVGEAGQIGRLGNDRFGLLIELNPDEDASKKISSILSPLQSRVSFKKEQVDYHMRAGVAVYPEDGETLEIVFSAANQALMRAKNQANIEKDKILFSQPIDFKHLETTLRATEKLTCAVKENRLELFFQPVHDKRDSSLLMLETLLRIRTPEGQLKTLKNYPGIIQDPHLCASLDNWVINQTIKQTANLPQKYSDLYISINLFPVSILKNTIFQEIDKLIDKYGHRRDRIVIEVPEKLLGTYSYKAFQNLVEMAEAHGFKIALDDFGVGHGSFKTLQEIPIDFLKIDGSFILNLAENELNQTFVTTLASLGDQIGVPVIAEWIETEATADKLMELGIHYHQGYYYKKPNKLDKLFD